MANQYNTGSLIVYIYVNNQSCNNNYGYSDLNIFNTVVSVCSTNMDAGINLVELKIYVRVSSCHVNPPAVVYYNEPIMII